MLRHREPPAHLGCFDPDWVRARERLVSQQRLRSSQEDQTVPWWAAAFSKARTPRADTEQ